MDIELLLKAVPENNKALAQPYMNQLSRILPVFRIDTPLRQAHFLAQLAHESGWFRYNKENLNYSTKALLAVFRKYFSSKELAESYARKPEMIANRVYANRMENGDEASGDGWKFRGRGLIQLTGKANYRAYSKDRRINFLDQPDLLSQPQWAVDSAAWFWNKGGLNALADKDDILSITKKINGGTNGLEDRKNCLKVFKKALGISE